MATPLSKYVSNPVRVPVDVLESGFDESVRIDLIIHEIDHSGPSYEGRIFFNNPDADEFTPLTEDSGYAGSFDIFGHEDCFGGAGHCVVPKTPRKALDKRMPHPLRPVEKKIIVTSALKRLADRSILEFPITVIAVMALGIRAEVLEFEGMSFSVYDGSN